MVETQGSHSSPEATASEFPHGRCAPDGFDRFRYHWSVPGLAVWSRRPDRKSHLDGYQGLIDVSVTAAHREGHDL